MSPFTALPIINAFSPASCAAFITLSLSSGRKEYDKEIIDALAEYDIDLICLAGYMRIVTSELVEAYKNKIMNAFYH